MNKRNLLITLGLLLAITAFFGIRSVLAKPEPACALEVLFVLVVTPALPPKSDGITPLSGGPPAGIPPP